MNVRATMTGAALGTVILGAVIFGFPALAQAACARVPDPAVSVQIVDPGPRVVSTKSLDQINVMAGSHGLQRPGFRVLGMTGIKVDTGINVKYKGQPVGNTVCVSVINVDVRFGLKEHSVHVPREYPRGSCQFNVVMRHEMAHVDVNRRTVRKYADILKNEMRSALRRFGAVAAASMVQGQNAQTAVVQQVLDDVSARFLQEREKLHAVIDQPGGQYAAGGQCNGW